MLSISRSRLLLILGILALSLAACAPAAPSPTAAPKPAATTAPAAAAQPTAAPKPAAPAKVVEVNAATINNMNNLPWFVGVEKGIWLKHGLDVKLKVLTTGPESAKALQSKEVDFGPNAFSNFLPAIDQGLPFVGLANTIGDSTKKFSDNQLLIAARDGSGIKTVADLSGKKLGLVTSGSTDEYIKAVLAKNKVPVEKVQLLNVPVGNTVSTMAGGQVDGSVTWEPFGVMVLDQVKGSYAVLRGGDYIPYFGLLMTRPDVIKDRPEVVQKFVDGWVEAMQWVRQNQAEAAEISTRWVPGLDLATAKKAAQYVQFDPRMTKLWLESLGDNNKLLLDQKKIKAPVDIAKAIDPSFLEKALKQYPQFVSDVKPAP